MTNPLKPIRLRQYGPNFTSVELGELDLFFSYETLVAIRERNAGWLISENVWSVTTAKHMNKHLPNQLRIENERWEQQVADVFKKYGLIYG